MKVYSINTPIKVYCCGVAWMHEMGETDITVYPTKAMCRKKCGCTVECGIVELEVRFSQWVMPQDLRHKALKKRKKK